MARVPQDEALRSSLEVGRIDAVGACGESGIGGGKAKELAP